MLQKDTNYCHNYSSVVYPHKELEDKKKNKLKRTKEEVEKDQVNNEEIVLSGVGDDEENKLAQNVVQKKRKLKKMDNEVLKNNDVDRANSSDNKVQKTEEVKHVESIVIDEEEPIDEGNQDTNKDTNADDKIEEKPDEKVEDVKEEKKEVQRAKKPDEPLEASSVDGLKEGSHASSDLGFPSLEAGSDEAVEN
jgi:hypothetical protein